MEQLLSGARRLGLSLTPGQLEMFRLYAAALARANRRANLTSVDRPERVERVHFLDSLTVASVLPPGVLAGGQVVDVGSGAGFPGVPLKVAFPALKVALVEARARRAGFLRHLVGLLGLEGVEVLQARAEELAHLPGLREAFDTALARALGKLPEVVELALPFVRPGGLVVVQKKGDFAPELERCTYALGVLGGSLEETRWLYLPELEGPRALVVIRKVAPTPQRYPRRPGIPHKRPLLPRPAGLPTGAVSGGP